MLQEILENSHFLTRNATKHIIIYAMLYHTVLSQFT